jgi:hypothetical protein
MKCPRALMPDDEAVELLVSHPFFQPDVTPIQVFNRATDPMPPVVKPDTFKAAMPGHIPAAPITDPAGATRLGSVPDRVDVLFTSAPMLGVPPSASECDRKGARRLRQPSQRHVALETCAAAVGGHG